MEKTSSAKKILAAARDGLITAITGRGHRIVPLADYQGEDACPVTTFTVKVGTDKLRAVQGWKDVSYGEGGGFQVEDEDGEFTGRPKVFLEAEILTVKPGANMGDTEKIDLFGLDGDEQKEVTELVAKAIDDAYDGWQVVDADEESLHDAITSRSIAARIRDSSICAGLLGQTAIRMGRRSDKKVYLTSESVCKAVAIGSQSKEKCEEDDVDEWENAQAVLDRVSRAMLERE